MTAFQSQAWLDCWQRSAASAKAEMPITVLVYRAGELGLVLPLSLSVKHGVRFLRWRGDSFNDYCGPIIDPALLPVLTPAGVGVLLTKSVEKLGLVDVVYLQKQPGSYGAVANPFVGEAALPHHVQSHATELGPSWDDYYRSKRSSKTRRRLKEKLNALSRLGTVEIGLCEDPDEARRLVARELEFKSVQLARRRNANPLSSTEAAAFLTDYFGTHCAGRAWVAALRLDQDPIAIAYGFRNADVWVLYQIAIKEGPYAAHSPGLHLFMHLLKTCCSQGVRYFDLSLGDESYKRDWCEMATTLFTTMLPVSGRGRLVVPSLKKAIAFKNFIAKRQTLLHRARQFRYWAAPALKAR
ncbi:MAG: GNAT family N-acetyltransferase [Aestuariivirga sp.]